VAFLLNTYTPSQKEAERVPDRIDDQIVRDIPSRRNYKDLQN
jgi:hypothetical protein